MITTSGALGILIPPSIVMVMYSVATNTSVDQLFIAGVVPGLMLAACWAHHHLVSGAQIQLPASGQGQLGPTLEGACVRRVGLAVDRGGDWRDLLRHLPPTEAAAMSAVYAFIVAVFVYRT